MKNALIKKPAGMLFFIVDGESDKMEGDKKETD